MNAEVLSWSVLVALGLLIFIALEFALIISILLKRSGDFSRIPRGEPGDFDIPRIEVVLIAPDLTQAVKNISDIRVVTSYVPPATVGGPKETEERGGRGNDKNTVGTEAVAPPGGQPPLKVSRVLPLVLVSRAGNYQQKMSIGNIQTVGDPKEQLYNLDINALLPRDLVLQIADRVGLMQKLKTELKRRDNYDDPLRLILNLGLVKLNSPVLRAPDSEEIEFAMDFVPLLTGGQTPILRVNDRNRPFVVTIGESPVAKGGAK
jgi:hypothetical protein